MGKGKGGESTSKVEVDPDVKKAALENMNLVRNIAGVGYAPNFGLTTAAFTPSQEAAFANTNMAAGAFGLPQSSGTGLPPAQNVGGFSGYSTKDLYNNSLAQMDPAQRAKLQAVSQNPFAKDPFAQPAAGGPGGGQGGGQGSGKSGSGKSSNNISALLNQIQSAQQGGNR